MLQNGRMDYAYDNIPRPTSWAGDTTIPFGTGELHFIFLVYLYLGNNDFIHYFKDEDSWNKACDHVIAS